MIKKYVLSGVPGSGKKQLMDLFSKKYDKDFYLMQNVAGDMGLGEKNMTSLPEKEIEKIQITGFRIQQMWEKGLENIKERNKSLQNESMVNWAVHYRDIYNLKGDYHGEMINSIREKGEYNKIFFLNSQKVGPISNIYLHNMLIMTYRDLGYEVLQENHSATGFDLEKRADWILSEIEK